MKSLLLLLLMLPRLTHAKCDVYYFSLDFGGAINDGHEIVDYLGKEDVPFTLFLVGRNSSTPGGKEVCEKIRKSPNKKIAIGNHTISHEGFNQRHSEEHIRKEIVGNEAHMNACDPKRVIKYFRYPKGSAHPLAEKVLKEAGYLGTYEEFFPQDDAAPSKAVWWTADTRDWVKSTGASAWAQIDYFNKHEKLLPVDQDSWRDLVSTLKSAPAGVAFNEGILNHLGDKMDYPTFEKLENVPGLHGPTEDEIVRKVLNDEGKLGKDGKRHCFPLMHYGGYNSYAALKKMIPALKVQKAEFRGLGDGDTVQHQLVSILSPINACKVIPPESLTHTVQAGESVFRIASTYINTNKTVCPGQSSPVKKLEATIIKLNKLSEPYDVIPGTKLIIPTDCLYVK